ncbi:hypothetical protein PB2503_06582 [Parvularcula bermudensis HTCC2503]|uniref:ABC3 transporter permease C-terminal domain-containing protein n=1 Tax=Parvularcula bermudensis (strain ATCC BAA-594 / HTCC2503 / KCTC 12087) TaxID=314260 RepID=E0TI43_PARBH|nr:FtsX-like permease family protein [Parvularcula bermudensis]ADM09382.1 hypothetical protein PB2503_06582 [Parvularcula bermudensis HTCC2503]
MIDSPSAPDDPPPEEGGSEKLPPRQSALLPEAGAAGTPLTVVLAVLAFIASIALAGTLMVARSTSDWTGELTGAITIQVRGTSIAEIRRNADAAEGVLQDTIGVLNLDRLNRQETEELLSPWLGTDSLGPDLPIPILITAEITPTLRANLSPLVERLAETAPTAVLDDHHVWNDRLLSAARKAANFAIVIFLTIFTATVSVIVFATRAGLAANQSTVEVMHLMGATDQFIADQVQRRYLTLSLRGGVAGAGVATLVLLAMAQTSEESSGALFLPNLVAAPTLLMWLSVVPLLLCATASIAARITVRQILTQDIS